MSLLHCYNKSANGDTQQGSSALWMNVCQVVAMANESESQTAGLTSSSCAASALCTIAAWTAHTVVVQIKNMLLSSNNLQMFKCTSRHLPCLSSLSFS